VSGGRGEPKGEARCIALGGAAAPNTDSTQNTREKWLYRPRRQPQWSLYLSGGRDEPKGEARRFALGRAAAPR